MEHLLLFVIVCAVGGVFAGLTSGLMALGGGMVIVPILNYAIPWVYPHLPAAYVLPMAIQTSFVVVFFNTLTSAIHQIARSNVSRRIVFFVAPGLMLGVLLASQFVTHINAGYLKVFFSLVIMYLAVNMLLPKKVPIEVDPMSWGKMTAPKGGIMGLIIGAISATAGIGGGGLLVPFFNSCKIPIHRAMGCASTCSCLLSLTGLVGYLYAGWHVDTGVPYTLGYMSLVGVGSFLLTSVIFASIGVKLQHVLPAKKLKKVFAFFILFVSLDIMYGGVHILASSST